MTTVHIVASCTERKRLPVSLSLRSVPDRKPVERAHLWWNRLCAIPGRTASASDLYSGDHWAVVRTLPQEAISAGFRSLLWVASAGYGLVPAAALLHPYSATFATGSPDSVARSATSASARNAFAQSWWETMSGFRGPDAYRPRSIAAIAKDDPKARILVVASADYIAAMEKDLLSAIERLASRESLVVVTGRDRLASQHLLPWVVPSDARLQAAVGGARTSLHARVARKILQEVHRWDLDATTLRTRFEALLDRSPAPETYDRERMTDAAVAAFIRRAVHVEPAVSCTALLRRLRREGHACEQGRFKRMYHACKGIRHAS